MKTLNESPLIVNVDPHLLGDAGNRLDVAYFNTKYQSVQSILESVKWQKMALKDLCMEPIRRGKTPDYEATGIPVVKTINLRNREIVLDPVSYVSEQFYGKNERCRIRKYDVLMASTGVGSIGKVDIVENDLGKLQTDTYR